MWNAIYYSHFVQSSEWRMKHLIPVMRPNAGTFVVEYWIPGGFCLKPAPHWEYHIVFIIPLVTFWDYGLIMKSSLKLLSHSLDTKKKLTVGLFLIYKIYKKTYTNCEKLNYFLTQGRKAGLCRYFLFTTLTEKIWVMFL